jgi:hypothetical protein
MSEIEILEISGHADTPIIKVPFGANVLVVEDRMERQEWFRQRMPFVNLPDKHESRWGESLTAETMKKCVWLRPVTVAQIEFLEWTEADRLRHSKFIRLREDKDPRKVVKERVGEVGAP